MKMTPQRYSLINSLLLFVAIVLLARRGFMPVEKLGTLSPLMTAAYDGDVPAIDRLVKSGAAVNARNDVGNTALHFAAGPTPISSVHRGSPQAVVYLIEHGADLNAGTMKIPHRSMC